ncbi:hypothetical protein KD146_07985 [Devosia sp. BSSL-BM10]|uniref:Uncharacterized protein n=1 Tax=Devosia litorisediminis TaxID=2829817 RepID=A0A942I692_9HYPH|nr:hypothetical protein [Devosia litorisediminis]MBS3848633.1 hypothetical protein [Devosia litorisediminis]
MASLTLAAPVAASGGIWCEGDNVFAEIGTGRLPVLHIVGAHAEAGEVAYSTGPERGDGKPFVVGQAFGDDTGIMIDFVDPNFQDIVVSIRLRYEGGDADWPLMGTMVLDSTSHAIRCGAD